MSSEIGQVDPACAYGRGIVYRCQGPITVLQGENFARCGDGRFEDVSRDSRGELLSIGVEIWRRVAEQGGKRAEVMC